MFERHPRKCQGTIRHPSCRRTNQNAEQHFGSRLAHGRGAESGLRKFYDPRSQFDRLWAENHVPEIISWAWGIELSNMKVSRAINMLPCAVEQPLLGGDEDTEETGSWIHEMPCKKLCELKTGRVHCTLRRAAVASDGLIVLQVDRCSHHRRLYAKRGAWNSKIRFTIHNTAMAPIGVLRQVKSNFSCHVYELAMVGTEKATDPGNADIRSDTNKRISAAVISYQVPSFKDFLSKSPPRRARIGLITCYETSTSESAPKLLDDPLVQFRKLVDGSSSCRSNNRVPALLVLESKEPYLKPNGRRGLDFAGRGSGSSAKNMQLVPAMEGDGESKIVLQMAKWHAKDGAGGSNAKEKVYHVDFATPITPFQAFGFALAQLDL